MRGSAGARGGREGQGWSRERGSALLEVSATEAIQGHRHLEPAPPITIPATRHVTSIRVRVRVQVTLSSMGGRLCVSSHGQPQTRRRSLRAGAPAG
eukprot:3278169-Rhodomonas_salina.1